MTAQFKRGKYFAEGHAATMKVEWVRRGKYRNSAGIVIGKELIVCEIGKLPCTEIISVSCRLGDFVFLASNEVLPMRARDGNGLLPFVD